MVIITVDCSAPMHALDGVFGMQHRRQILADGNLAKLMSHSPSGSALQLHSPASEREASFNSDISMAVVKGLMSAVLRPTVCSSAAHALLCCAYVLLQSSRSQK